MSISLKKGQRIDLTKDNAGLNSLLIGLGWDPAEPAKAKGGLLGGLFGGAKQASVDCDSSVIMLKDDRLHDKNDVVFFGNLSVLNGAVKHTGDNVTGEGKGDDEQVLVQLKSIPTEYNRLVFVVNIYDAVKRNQHFGMIKNAYIRIVDQSTNRELLKYNLSDDYADQKTLITGEIYRNGNEWKFAALGNGTTDGSLSDIIKKYT